MKKALNVSTKLSDGREISLETGKLAKQADGSVELTKGKTMIIATVVDKLEAKENIREVHYRQPVIINQTDVNRYLNLELQGSAFLKECSKPNLIFHEVSKDVNKPTNNSASLVQAV